jgi:hypothetical protein
MAPISCGVVPGMNLIGIPTGLKGAWQREGHGERSGIGCSIVTENASVIGIQSVSGG